MPSFTVEEASAQLAQLLDQAQTGQEVIITRDGEPIAQLRPLQSNGTPFPFGSAATDPNVNWDNLAQDDWWKPMTDGEYESFLQGRY